MKSRRTKTWIASGLLIIVVLLTACSTQPVKVKETAPQEVGGVQEEAEMPKPRPTAMPAKESASPETADPVAGTGGSGSSIEALAAMYRSGRLIIKNAELKLTVEDTTVAIDLATQVAEDTLGYIVSSRTWYKGTFQYATLTLGVPVHEFEGAMRRLRGMAVKVDDENASGTDITDQVVDLESRLRNLEATEARIRTFLDQATTVDESLHVNQTLSEITAQIEEIKGQMAYLKDRAAYSTITVHLSPQLPTPTPTPTFTPTPIPVPDKWNPGKTFQSASAVLGGMVRGIVDAVIWVGVVFGPFILPLGIIVWMVLRANRKKVV